MFSNFLYVLVALMIYITADLLDPPDTVGGTGLFASVGLALAFAVVCRFAFGRIIRQGRSSSSAALDRKVSQTVTQFSVCAIVLFAGNIYFFRLNHLAAQFFLFKWVPTLQAIVFLSVFIGYLALIWDGAYRIQRRYFPGGLSKKEFIVSNIAVALPALLPWCLLSLLSDLFAVLPFDALNQFFATTTGELVYIFVFLAAISIFGPVFIQRLWRCKPLPMGDARAKIEAVCRGAGLKYNDILRWELFGGHMITAGVMGIVGRFRYILVTPALLNALDDDEIEGVILHEIGHVRYHHMLFYLLFFSGFIACNFVFFEPLFLLLYAAQPVYTVFEAFGVSMGTAHVVLVCAVLVGLFLIYFRLIFGFYMRNFERQADLHVFEFQPDPSALISTFYKIAALSRQSIDKPSWHHYSVGERIRFLETCRKLPAQITRHHARVKRLVWIYVMGVVAAFLFGYRISYGDLNAPFGQYIAGKILAQELSLDPENSGLYVMVGDYYYNARMYLNAMDAYENVLRIDPKNVHALNNLAWLLVTCPEDGLRDPIKALKLAENALALSEEAFLLDTYAEALFLNGRKGDALEAATKALAMADDKRSYYEAQVKRFERAQNKQ